MMKRKTVSYAKMILLCFIGAIKYNEYKKSIDFLLKMTLDQKVDQMEEIIFDNPKQIYFDHKIEEPTFMALSDVIINTYGYKQEKYLKSIKWNGKLFYYVDKQADHTYYHIIASKKVINQFLTIYNFKSWSVKRNLTKKERKFVYMFINGYFRNRYSWSYLYFEQLQDDIKKLKENIESAEEWLEELYTILKDTEFLKGLEDPYTTVLKNEIEELLEDIEEMEIILKSKKSFEDNLLYSISDKPTTLEDYKMEDS